jgi:hypothetical protein
MSCSVSCSINKVDSPNISYNSDEQMYILISFVLEKLIPHFFPSSMISHQLKDDFALLRPQGYLVEFFLEFLQRIFILKCYLNVATDHVNA